MDVPAKDRKYGPVDSTIFLSKDRLFGHSTRPHNFKVTHTEDLETKPCRGQTNIYLSGFAMQPRKMSLFICIKKVL